MSQYVRDAGETTPMLSFEDRNGGPGLTVVDHVENRRCEVRTSDTVFPTAVSAEKFQLPVDCAAVITTKRLSFPHTVAAYIRDETGAMIKEATKGADLAFPERIYRFELAAPIKLCAVVESGFEMSVSAEHATVTFDRETEVYLGARSNHDRPATTVTTTDEPEDLMRAVSVFGSALKTTSCERSYPTLRGHPPRIEQGNELAIPSMLDTPETGITIEVPPEYRMIYVVAPLAYYFGAEVEAGPKPKLVTEDGFVYHLDGTDRGFENEVERLLKQCFFFDCITRTEGYYPVSLHERNEIEGEIELDFSTLYGRPIPKQLEAYLAVEYDVIEPYVPRWKLTAHVDPIPAHVEVLPFLVQDLAVIRSKEVSPIDTDASAPPPESLGITEFLRGSEDPQPAPEDINDDDRLVRIDESDALEDVWIGDGIPFGASKGMIEAFQNRLGRRSSGNSIDITVVVNDSKMTREGNEVNKVYGSRESLPFDVTILQQLTVEELLAAFDKETDFLHYIGHIDDNGFQCVDGVMDAKKLDSTHVSAYFLNACGSYEQGKELIKSGAIAAAATLTPIPNEEAEEMGKKLAQLCTFKYSLV